MSLTKEHFTHIINKLVQKLHQDKFIRFYIETHPHSFEYKDGFLGYYIENKLVKFIDLVCESYLTYSERLDLLDDILTEAKLVIGKAHSSENLLEYYLSKVDSL